MDPYCIFSNAHMLNVCLSLCPAYIGIPGGWGRLLGTMQRRSIGGTEGSWAGG